MVKGRVQGVFFRAWTRGVARELGLRGSVRNRRDGSVEAHVLGSVESVSEFEERIRMGPPAAHVVEFEKVSSTHTIGDGPFEVLPTI